MDKKTTSKEELTPKQGELLKVIQTYIGKNGFPPSIREIAKLMGLSSTATVHTHLQALKAKGYIKVNSSKKRQSRAFEVTDEQSENLNKIPLVGEVAAGTGVIAEENITDYYDLPSLLTNNIDASSLFMLRVKGESMIDAGIFDGDYIVARTQTHASNGDFVIAGIFDDEATVKEFKQKDSQIQLIPHNSKLEVMEFDARAITIYGVVVSVMRNL